MLDDANKLLWPNWVEAIKDQAQREEVVRFVGYGSLINIESVKKTLVDFEVTKVVTAFGAKRIFNFSLDDGDYKENGGRNERSLIANHRACLNVFITGDDKDELVGVLIELKPDQVQAFADREYGYDIAPITYTALADNETKNAYILVARKKGEKIGHMVQDNILPNETYLKTCLQGAINHGDDFLTSWLGSCYLADGKTKLVESNFYSDFINSHLEELLVSDFLNNEQEQSLRKILEV